MIDEMTQLAADIHWDYGAARLSYRAALGPFVYFIRSGDTIKIGCSDTPELRVDQIRRGGRAMRPSAGIADNPKLLAYGPGGYEKEAEYHARFAAQLDQGEWFHESPELTTLIHETANAQARLEVEWQDADYQKRVAAHGWPARTFDLDALTAAQFESNLDTQGTS